jgi:hypothetical protein
MFGLNLERIGNGRCAGNVESRIKSIVLNGSDSVAMSAVLKISTAQETVVVSVESAAIDTEDQTISQTIDNQAVIELPRDSRNVYSFLYLNQTSRRPTQTAPSSSSEHKATAPAS